MAFSAEAFIFHIPVVSKMTSTRKKNGLKIAGIILLILIAAGGGIIFYLKQHYKSIIRKKLPGIATQATDSLYIIEVDHYSVNLFSKSFSIHGLHMYPDTAVFNRRRLEGRAPQTMLDILVKEVEISGLKWKEVARSKEVMFSAIDIYHPRIDVVMTDDPPATDTFPKKKPAVEQVYARSINIIDPEIRYRSSSRSDAFFIRAKGGLISARDWVLRPQALADTNRFFNARSADIRLEKLACGKPGILYTFGADTFHFLSAAHRLKIAGGYVKPTVGKEAFYEAEKKQKELYEASFPRILINELDWESLLTRRRVSAESIFMKEPDLEIFLSRLVPANTQSRMGNYPHQLLQKLGFPLDIPEINIEDGRFRYKEQNDKTHRVGTLDFSQIDGQIIHMTNIWKKIVQHPDCHIKLAGKFMHKSDIQATFTFPLATGNGRFNVKGALHNLEAGQVTETSKALALAAVKSLKLHELNFDINGNDTASDGRISIIYNDLKVKLQKVDEATREMHNRGFLSMVANELLLYNDNPMDGEALRVAITHVRRDSTKSFFNLIWKNMFDAGLQTAIRQEGAADLVKKRKERMGKEKVHFFRKLFPKRKRTGPLSAR